MSCSTFKKWLEIKSFRVIFVAFLLIVVQFVFSGYSVVCVLYVKGKYDPWLVVLFRVLIAIPVNVVMALVFEGKFSLWQKDLKCQMFFMFFGLTHVAINALFYLHIIIFINASYASILTQLIPIFSAGLSMIFSLEPKPTLKNRTSMIRVIGIACGVVFSIAISVISFNEQKGSETNIKKWILGTMFGIIRAIMESFYYVAQVKIFYRDENNPLRKKPWTIICLSTIYGAMGFCVIFISYACGKNFEFTIDKNFILPVSYSGILNIAVGYGLLNFCIKYSSAMISSCMFSMNIATSLIFLKLFAKESLLLSQYLLSIPLVFCGLLVILSPLFSSEKKEVQTQGKIDDV